MLGNLDLPGVPYACPEHMRTSARSSVSAVMTWNRPIYQAICTACMAVTLQCSMTLRSLWQTSASNA